MRAKLMRKNVFHQCTAASLSGLVWSQRLNVRKYWFILGSGIQGPDLRLKEMF